MKPRAYGRTRFDFVRRWLIETALLEVCDALVPLLNAGLSLSESLPLVQATGLGRLAKAYAEGLNAALLAGKELTSVWADELPALYRVFVTQSQYTGALGPALAAWQRSVQQRKQWQQEMLKMSAYPVFLCLLAACLAAMLVNTVLPILQQLYEQLGTGHGTGRNALVVVVEVYAAAVWTVILALGVGLWGSYLTSRMFPSFWERIAPRLPGFRLLHDARMSLLCLWLGHLLQSGVPIVDGLKLFCTPDFPMWLRRVAEEALERVLLGKGILDAFAWYADAMFTTAMVTAEQTGELAESLIRLENAYRMRLTKRVQKRLRFLEPVLMVIAGSMVAGCTLLLYVPMYDALSQLSAGGGSMQ